MGLILLSFALARPQWGIERRTNQPTGIDLIIALDVSKACGLGMLNPTVLSESN